MKIESAVMVVAGGMVFVSVLLAWFHSQYWLFLSGFVGLNLFQAGFTKFCPLAVILKKAGMKSGSVF